MAKDPAVLFYTSDFLTGTAFMNFDQRGKYITLLCLQHQHGHLTEEQIKAITSDEIIKEKFILAEDGKFHNVRLHEEIVKRKAFCESRRKSRLIGIKKQRTSNVRQPHVERTENENENENEKRKKKMKKEINYSIEFEQFWKLYPKKIAKPKAFESWNRINPTNGDVQKILSAVETQKKSKDWIKDEGQFIPHPTTWLNQHRWEDQHEILTEGDPEWLQH